MKLAREVVADRPCCVEVGGGISLGLLQWRLRGVPDLQGLTQRGDRTYACFKADPSDPVKAKLHRIAGKP